jgi:hypothetical protein
VLFTLIVSAIWSASALSTSLQAVQRNYDLHNMGAGGSTSKSNKQQQAQPKQPEITPPLEVRHESPKTAEFDAIRQEFLREKSKGVSNSELFARMSMRIPSDSERLKRVASDLGGGGAHVNDANMTTPANDRAQARFRVPATSPSNR